MTDMKITTFFLAVLGILLLAGCRNQSAFYVSPTGDDTHSGTRGRPFATLERASRAVRSAWVSGQQVDVTVYLAGGIYNLEEPVVFKPEDSGRNGGRVIYRAMAGEQPILSGGKQIGEWERGENGLWVAKVPQVNGKPWIFRELFVDGERATRARHPDQGYLRVARVGEDKRTNFSFNPGDFPIPGDAGEVELVLLHDWSITRIPLRRIDSVESQIFAIDSIGAKGIPFFTLDHWEPHPRYFLENSPAFLDRTFEWYLDRETSSLYLKLPEGMDPGELEIIAPVTGNLILLDGTEEEQIKNICFEGLSFSHCAFDLPSGGYAGVQACHFDNREGGPGWRTIPCAIEGRWTAGCSFKDCSLTHLGGSGLRFGSGSRDCVVTHCSFSDISGNGIMIGEGRDRLVGGAPWWKSVPQEVASGNRVEDCIITRTGRQFYGAVGIWCGITARTQILRNQVSEMPYTGVSMGWHWSTEPTPCREFRIEGNHIHHVMETLSDGGGIYTLGWQPGSEIINNRIHHVDINAGRAESNGMFLDEGTTDVTIARNLIYGIARSPLRFHRATTNLVENNVLVCNEGIPPVRYNRIDEKDIVMKGNLILSTSNKEDMSKLAGLIETWEKENNAPDP
jgi:hypothetical protein